MLLYSGSARLRLSKITIIVVGVIVVIILAFMVQGYNGFRFLPFLRLFIIGVLGSFHSGIHGGMRVTLAISVVIASHIIETAVPRDPLFRRRIRVAPSPHVIRPLILLVIVAIL